MKIVEFRIHMPLSLQENLIGQAWIKTVHNQLGDTKEFEG